MEIFLAIVVISAVIFFGALISIGNERQSNAIDGLREQVLLWAMQDLKIKRKHLEHAVQIPDPLEWLAKVTTNAFGYNVSILSIEHVEDTRIIRCHSRENNLVIIFTTLSPSEILRIKKDKRNRLSIHTSTRHLVLSTEDKKASEISLLNSDIYFDYEFTTVWKEITGEKPEKTDRFWVYL